MPAGPRLPEPILLTILNVIAPVFLLIGLGWALMRGRFFSAGVLHDVNRLCYWVALPALLFHRIGGASPDFVAAADLLIAIIGATFLGILAAMLVAWLGRLERFSRGAFIQGAFRGNAVFVGLPVVLYAFDAAGLATAQAEASVLLIIGPLVVVYNIMAVVILLFSAGGISRSAMRAAGRGLVTNPLLIACAAGLVVSLLEIQFPLLADRTLNTLGSMAFPLALICIGGALYLTPIQGNLRVATAGAAMKVFLLPVFGLMLAWWLGLSAEQTLITALMLASPTAAASYVLTRQLKGDDGLASGIILLSHILAIPALVVLLAVLA